jgi:SAM-dependent methyltransferase
VYRYPAPVSGMPGAAPGPGHSAVDRDDRERDFWGHHIPSLETCLAEYAAGPDENTEAMLQVVSPMNGARILDFACGGGVTTAWMAARGAEVTGVDLSPDSLARAREVLGALGLAATFVTTLEAAAGLGPFDGVVGRFALHHTNVPEMAPQLARLLRPGGAGAFVETFGTNPVLRFARQSITGRFGVRKLGTDDERPLDRADLAALEAAFGRMTVRCAQMYFLRILDRQVLQYRYPRASAAMGWIDDRIGQLPRSVPFSYFQVVEVHRPLREGGHAIPA